MKFIQHVFLTMALMSEATKGTLPFVSCTISTCYILMTFLKNQSNATFLTRINSNHERFFASK
jgi:hypothetical protein